MKFLFFLAPLSLPPKWVRSKSVTISIFIATAKAVRTVLNAQTKAGAVFLLSTQHSALSTLLYHFSIFTFGGNLIFLGNFLGRLGNILPANKS